MSAAAAAPGPPPHRGEECQDEHAALAAVAARQGCTSSRLVGTTVSRHAMPSTISFANLSAMHAAVRESSKRVPQHDFVATSGRSLVFSSRFRFEAPAPQQQGGAGRKRQRDARDDQEERVVEARNRLERVVSATVPSEELDAAQDVLVRLVTELRGPAQELLVQSYAMLSKKLQSADERPSIVLAIRFNAGIAIPVAHLKRCLGSCWRDGVVSTEASVNGVCDRDLPLTEEGDASREQGNAPMLVVTSVPMHA